MPNDHAAIQSYRPVVLLSSIFRRSDAARICHNGKVSIGILRLGGRREGVYLSDIVERPLGLGAYNESPRVRFDETVAEKSRLQSIRRTTNECSGSYTA